MVAQALQLLVARVVCFHGGPVLSVLILLVVGQQRNWPVCGATRVADLLIVVALSCAHLYNALTGVAITALKNWRMSQGPNAAKGDLEGVSKAHQARMYCAFQHPVNPDFF